MRAKFFCEKEKCLVSFAKSSKHAFEQEHRSQYPAHFSPGCGNCQQSPTTSSPISTLIRRVIEARSNDLHAAALTLEAALTTVRKPDSNLNVNMATNIQSDPHL
jgi:hypothetical protein